jgi:hypothetical protein
MTIERFLWASAALMIAVFVWVVVDDIFAAKFSLHKDEWQCTKQADKSSTLIVGKVIVPRQVKECVQWTKL